MKLTCISWVSLVFSVTESLSKWVWFDDLLVHCLDNLAGEKNYALLVRDIHQRWKLENIILP